MRMTKEVMVTISGLQMANEEQDTIELVHVGEYYERNGTHYLLFDELMEGIATPIKNVIKLKDRYMEVQKKGPIAAKLIFEEGKSQSSTYSVPYGSFLMSTYTTGVQIREEEEKLEAVASYRLSINGEHCADCDISVKAEPRESFRL